MNPEQIARQVRTLGVDHHTAVHIMVNAVAVNHGLPAPWDAPDLDLPALEDIAEIGDVHQLLLGGKRGEQGSYFTPAPLAEFTTRASIDVPLARGTHPLSVLAMDPSCGAGVFLVMAARRLARALLAVDFDVTDPQPWMVRNVLPLIAVECVFGVDIDPIAVDLAKSALWLEAGGIPPITFMDRNVICGDTLSGAEPPKLRERLHGHLASGPAVPDPVSAKPVKPQQAKPAAATTEGTLFDLLGDEGNAAA